MSIDPRELQSILQKNEIINVKIDEEAFFYLLPSMSAYLQNTKGFIYIIDNKSAKLFFSEAHNVSLSIKLSKKFDANRYRNIGIKVFGSKVQGKFLKFLIDEFRLHWKSMMIIFFLLGPFLIIQGNNEFVKELNTALISCMAILIGVFLVFITFFYIDKEHEINYFTRGTFSVDFRNDKYIVYLSILTVVIALMSIGISYYKYDSSFKYLIGSSPILAIYSYILLLKYNNLVSGITTLLSILTFWLSFRAMTDYYFDRIHHQITIVAIKKVRKEFFKEDNEE